MKQNNWTQLKKETKENSNKEKSRFASMFQIINIINDHVLETEV